ncbi:DICT sensory domain-containing protein [Halorussus salinus]|uniref:DICT sensory domain-containing protein n=1 Tax=Halorussus salinus TaxID=1364935 RepID=UPI00109314F7|nr:DICT sensory domain-containing protein [Halorussus salinus]
MSNNLGVFIEDIRSVDRHLAVVNAEETDERVAELLNYFERYAFEVTTAMEVDALPEAFLVLSDGERCLAAIGVGTLHDYLIDALDAESFPPRYADDPRVVGAVQTFLTALDENVYSVECEDKISLLEISRVVEEQAGHEGAGTLHTGCQRLSRLRDERETWDTYRRIANSGVDVNLYGIPDWRPPEIDSITAFGDDEGDHVTDLWFVVYEADDDEASGALLAREVEPGRYTGFWTFRPERVREVAAYIQSDLQSELARLDGE